MSDDLRKQIYPNFSRQATEALLEIWRIHDRDQWSDTTFDVIREILQERHIELPPQNQPVYETSGSTHTPTRDRERRSHRQTRVTGPSTSYVRAMEPREIVESAFGLYRRGFGTVLALAAPFMLAGVVALVLQIYVSLGLPKILSGSSLGLIAARTGTSLLGVFLVWFSSLVVAAAMTLGTSHAVLRRPVSVAGTYRVVLSGPLLRRVLAGSAVAALVAFSTALLGQGLGTLIPSGDLIASAILFWLSVRFGLFPQVVVLEKARVWEGFERSWRLTANHTLRVALTWLRYLVYICAVTMVIALVSGLVGFVFALIVFGPGLDESTPALGVPLIGLAGLLLLLAPPLGMLLNVLMYYSLRCDAEEYGERQLAGEL